MVAFALRRNRRYKADVLTADFDYSLPDELIAQVPAPRREASRLFLLDRAQASFRHLGFGNFAEFLSPGDVLVLNDSKVIPARLWATKAASGGRIEILLAEEAATNEWWALLRPGKRVRPTTQLVVRDPDGRETELRATVLDKNPEGLFRLRFAGVPDVKLALETLGEMPLPPYIHRPAPGAGVDDRERYQTVFARRPGSVAAPTAGLHFTAESLEAIRARGVHVGFVTLHVGLGTFAPVKADSLEGHRLHEEWFELSASVAAMINGAKRRGARVFAVGTTTLRVLETVARQQTQPAVSRQTSLPCPETRAEGQATPGAGEMTVAPRPCALDSDHQPLSSPSQDCSALTPSPPSPAAPVGPLTGARGRTSLFVYPPFEFKVVDALLTNFHLPRSTLLMLVSAFAAPGRTNGRELVLSAYAEAIRERYRFYSYGDAMLIL